MKLIFTLPIGLLLLQSCKTNLVYIKTTNPAPVTITTDIKKIGIVNRSIPDEKNAVLNTVHQSVTAQTLNIIKEGSAECMRGLRDELQQDSRFEVIKLLDTVKLRTPVMGSFPSALSWEDINRICLQNQVDIVYCLDVFDTQLKVTPVTVPVGQLPTKPIDVIGTVAQQQANITTTIKTGWRIYDPNKKLILDEYPDTDVLTVTASLMNITNTAEAMLGRKEAIKQSANKQGHRYAIRILPYRFTVTRDYYVKGNPNFKMAMRKARTGNWDGAGAIWQSETNNPKQKLAGRACYNMAIISEINGDLDGAIQWAQKAYEDHRNRLALKYINILKDRKYQVSRLEFQQEQKN